MSSVYCGGASASFISNARQIVAFILARAPNLFEYALLTEVNSPWFRQSLPFGHHELMDGSVTNQLYYDVHELEGTVDRISW